MPRLRRLRGARGRAGRSCPSSGCAARTSSSSPASAAPSRFPYYLDTYGMHSIHGRAPSIATGLATAREDLVGVGRHRRRRRALDRRQPPDPRAAPQREHDDPAVQQPDLRPHQGPVLPHLRGRQDHQVDPDGLARPPVQPGLAGARRRGAPSSPAPSTPTASTSPRCSPRPPPTAARRSSRSTRTARSSTTAPSTRSRTPTPRPTRSSRSSTASRSGSAPTARARRRPRPGDRRRARSSRSPTSSADALLVHDAHNADPTTAFAISRLTDSGYLHQSPIGIFRQVERPTYDDQARDQIATAREAVTGDADERLAALLGGGDTWTVV